MAGMGDEGESEVSPSTMIEDSTAGVEGNGPGHNGPTVGEHETDQARKHREFVRRMLDETEAPLIISTPSKEYPFFALIRQNAGQAGYVTPLIEISDDMIDDDWTATRDKFLRPDVFEYEEGWYVDGSFKGLNITLPEDMRTFWIGGEPDMRVERDREVDGQVRRCKSHSIGRGQLTLEFFRGFALEDGTYGIDPKEELRFDKERTVMLLPSELKFPMNVVLYDTMAVALLLSPIAARMLQGIAPTDFDSNGMPYMYRRHFGGPACPRAHIKDYPMPNGQYTYDMRPAFIRLPGGQIYIFGGETFSQTVPNEAWANFHQYYCEIRPKSIDKVCGVLDEPMERSRKMAMEQGSSATECAMHDILTAHPNIPRPVPNVTMDNIIARDYRGKTTDFLERALTAASLHQITSRSMINLAHRMAERMDDAVPILDNVLNVLHGSGAGQGTDELIGQLTRVRNECNRFSSEFDAKGSMTMAILEKVPSAAHILGRFVTGPITQQYINIVKEDAELLMEQKIEGTNYVPRWATDVVIDVHNVDYKISEDLARPSYDYGHGYEDDDEIEMIITNLDEREERQARTGGTKRKGDDDGQDEHPKKLAKQTGGAKKGKSKNEKVKEGGSKPFTVETFKKENLNLAQDNDHTRVPDDISRWKWKMDNHTRNEIREMCSDFHIIQGTNRNKDQLIARIQARVSQDKAQFFTAAISRKYGSWQAPKTRTPSGTSAKVKGKKTQVEGSAPKEGVGKGARDTEERTLSDIEKDTDAIAKELEAEGGSSGRNGGPSGHTG